MGDIASSVYSGILILIPLYKQSNYCMSSREPRLLANPKPSRKDNIAREPTAMTPLLGSLADFWQLPLIRGSAGEMSSKRVMFVI
jgi:hypothetical protein